MRLINGSIKNIKVPLDERTGELKADHIVWDDELKGFGLRIRQGKERVRRSYIIQYKIGPLHRRMVIGDADKVEPKQARAKAKKELAKVELGEDPQGEKKEARKVGTFRGVAEAFIAYQKGKNRREATVYCSRLYLLDYCKPLHPLRLNPDEIGRAQIAAVLTAVKKEHGPVSADRCRAALSSMFAWGLGEGACSNDFINPVIGTNTQSEGGSRGRSLEEEEIAAIWNACGDDDFGRIVRLLFLTGCRRNEIAKLRWDEVQVDLISLPETRTKNHLRFDVPLTDCARNLIGQRPVAEEGVKPREYVFGRYSTSKGFGGFSQAKKELNARLGESVKPWRLHDIRHTVSTGMSELKNKKGQPLVDPHIVEACLNHVSGAAKAGVAGRYNHAKYNGPKRMALELWERHILTIVTPNVTRMKSAAG